MVHTTAPLEDLVTSARAHLRRLDAAVPLYRVRAMPELLQSTVWRPRIVAYLLAGVSGLCLLISAVTVYAVTATVASSRLREFGVRAALGAPGRSLAVLVLRSAVAALLGGMVCGIAITAVVRPGLRSVLPTMTDSLVPLVIAAAVVTAVVLVACIRPALLAARAKPLLLLR